MSKVIAIANENENKVITVTSEAKSSTIYFGQKQEHLFINIETGQLVKQPIPNTKTN